MDRRELRQRARGLRDLVNAWDPIGVFADPEWPRDEYECIVGPLLQRLASNALHAELTEYLYDELTGHFGLMLPRAQAERWAREAQQYYLFNDASQ